MDRAKVAVFLFGVFGLANVVNALSIVATAGLSLASGIALLGGLTITVLAGWTVRHGRYDGFDFVADSTLFFWVLVLATVGFTAVAALRFL